MPTRRIQTNLAANASVTNILAGEDIEFPGRPSEVEVAITADAIGIVCDVQFGSDIQARQAVVAVEDAAGQGPKLPDHLIVSDVAASSDRIIVGLINTTAGALVVTTLVRVTAV